VNRLMLTVRRERLTLRPGDLRSADCLDGRRLLSPPPRANLSLDQSYLDRGWVNYLIAPADRTLPGRVVAQDGAWVLRDLSLFPCTRQSPPFSWRL
jgi:hypothetical protein